MATARRNFKNISSIPLFIIIFRPEMLKFYPSSILTGDTRVEFVIVFVLSTMNEQSVINYSSRARELGSVNKRGTEQT